MTDSKTEKKIQVLPCNSHKGNAVLLVKGAAHYFGDKGVCVPEAEAQAKAAELRGECPDCGSDEPAKTLQILSPFPGSDIPIDRDCDNKFHAAAQPTETRPPRHEHPEACPVCDSPYCEHDEAEQNLIKKAWEAGYAARASSPVARPQPLAIGEAGKHLQSVTRKVEWPEDDPDTDMAEPAARVEQPCTHGTLTLRADLKYKCRECGEALFDTAAPAAPVVEQREEDFWMKACIHLIFCNGKECGRCHRIKQDVELNRRTDGEGQPK